MKFNYWEGESGLLIDITPETPEEVAQLLRVTQNAKAIKPDITLYFSTDKPYVNVC